MPLSLGWSLRDCAVEWDQPERDIAESSPLCFSPAGLIAVLKFARKSILIEVSK